jgi:hypothetical protein
MAISIGPKGWVDLFAAAVGPKNKVRVVAIENNVPGGATAGDANQPFVDPGMQPIAAINVKTGSLVTSSISDTGTETGKVKILDTGAIGGSYDPVWLFYTDTGV